MSLHNLSLKGIIIRSLRPEAEKYEGLLSLDKWKHGRCELQGASGDKRRVARRSGWGGESFMKWRERSIEMTRNRVKIVSCGGSGGDVRTERRRETGGGGRKEAEQEGGGEESKQR